MPVLAVIDDNEDERETLINRLELTLSDYPNWVVIGQPPLDTLEEYPGWLVAHEVAVLILDEQLQQSAPIGSHPVIYQGHNVIDAVRQRQPDLPIWVITAYSDVAGLQKRFPDVEDILRKSLFHKKSSDYVPRIVRSGNRFFEENQKQLRELSDIAEKVATGIATEEDVERAKTLQLYTFAPMESFVLQRDWVSELETVVKEFAQLEEKIKGTLANNESGMVENRQV